METERMTFQLDRSVVEQSGWEKLIPLYFGPSTFVSSFGPKSLTVGAKMPVLIKDSKSGEKFLKCLVFDHLAEFALDYRERFVKIDSPSTKVLAERASAAISREYDKVEQLVLNVTQLKLLDIPVIRTTLTPFYQLLTHLLSENELQASAVQDVVKRKGKVKADMYLAVLVSMGIVREGAMPDRYVSGNLLVAAQAKAENNILGKLMGLILAKNYRYLTSKMKLWAIMPYVRISTAYYSPAFYLRDMIRLNLAELNIYHKNIYGHSIAGIRSKLVLEERIDEMTKVGLLDREADDGDGYIIGNKSVLDGMSAEQPS